MGEMGKREIGGEERKGKERIESGKEGRKEMEKWREEEQDQHEIKLEQKRREMQDIM